MSTVAVSGKGRALVTTGTRMERGKIATMIHRPIHPIFDVVPFDAEHWLLALGVGILPLVAMEIWKAGSARHGFG